MEDPQDVRALRRAVQREQVGLKVRRGQFDGQLRGGVVGRPVRAVEGSGIEHRELVGSVSRYHLSHKGCSDSDRPLRPRRKSWCGNPRRCVVHGVGGDRPAC